MISTINDKFYDFINMYNAIIKHCINKNRQCDISISYIKDTLYFKVSDKISGITLHDDSLECSEEESKLIYSMISNEFILNHNLKYAAYLPMTNNDVSLYKSISQDNKNITFDSKDYFNNQQAMKIHAFENSVFTLRIYLYKGIDEQTNILHEMALNKAYNDVKRKSYTNINK